MWVSKCISNLRWKVPWNKTHTSIATGFGCFMIVEFSPRFWMMMLTGQHALSHKLFCYLCLQKPFLGGESPHCCTSRVTEILLHCYIFIAVSFETCHWRCQSKVTRHVIHEMVRVGVYWDRSVFPWSWEMVVLSILLLLFGIFERLQDLSSRLSTK